MEGITGLKLLPNHLLRKIGYFPRQPVPALKDPFGKLPGHRLPHALPAYVFKQAPPDDLGDFFGVRGNKRHADAPYHLGKFYLPFIERRSHLRVGYWQAQKAHGPVSRRQGAGQVLHKGVKLVGLVGIAPDIVQGFIKENQNRFIDQIKKFLQSCRSRRTGAGGVSGGCR